VLDLVAIAMIIVVLLLQVFATGSVTVARMQGAIAAYLGFGVLWAHAFTIAAKVNPGSFRGGLVSGSLSNWIYYSFETLTTLGYGDIVPLSQTARMLAVGEAITGQLYLAVLLAHLVSMRVSGALITKESTLKI
jgi:voltage-gated potassium channel Kch